MVVAPPGGWFKFGAWLVNIFLSMIGVENKLGRKKGAEKKKRVMQVAETQAKNLGLVEGEGECDLNEILELISEIVDRVVRLLNCFGLFSHGP